MDISRRRFLLNSAVAGGALAISGSDPAAPYQTPYKYPKLFSQAAAKAISIGAVSTTLSSSTRRERSRCCESPAKRQPCTIETSNYARKIRMHRWRSWADTTVKNHTEHFAQVRRSI